MKTDRPPESGFYVDLHKTPDGDLAIRLNANGRAHFATVEEHRDAYGIYEALCALLHDHLAGGWEMVEPAEIGALTDAPILSDDVQRDEAGQVTEVGRIYWYPDYAVRDEIAELREKLVVLFRGAV